MRTYEIYPANGAESVGTVKAHDAATAAEIAQRRGLLDGACDYRFEPVSMYDEPTNEDRAEWVRAALEAFCRHTGQAVDRDGTDEIVGDFIADLRHFVDRFCEADFDGLLDTAERHYREEHALESEDGEGSGLPGVYSGGTR